MHVVCGFCREQVLEKNRIWGYHQSFEGLRESAEADCVLCKRLFDDAKERSAAVKGRKTTLHRWTIRRPGRIRESREYVVLTFRPFEEKLERGESEQKGALEVSLPVRTFYLVPEEGEIPWT